MIILFFLLFGVLMIGVLGGMFAFLSYNLCEPLAAAGMDWLYFAIMGMISIMLGVFGSVFNTYASLYLAKDNDLLFSMPIPVQDIVISRLANVYLIGLMYSIVVILPADIVYWIRVSCTPSVVAGGIVLLILITLFVLVLSCVLGWVVAKVSLKMKNKSLVTVVISLVFIGAYYFFYFKAQAILSDLIANAAVYGDKIKGAAYGVYLFGCIGTGDWKAMLIFGAIVLALTAGTWILLKKTFLSISTSTGAVKKAAYHEKTAKQKSADGALLGREFQHFLANPTYMLNCGLGILLIPAMGVLMQLKGRGLTDALEGVFGAESGCATALYCAFACMVASLNDMAVPSISLEGKSIWLAQSLPVRPWQVLRSKLLMQLFLTGIPAAFTLACTVPFVRDGAVVRILFLLFVLLSVLLMALAGLFLGIKFANLKWTNEMTPIKQGLSVFIILIGSWVYCAAVAGLYLWQGIRIGITVYLGIASAIAGVCCLVLYYWLRTQGTKRFMELG